MFSNRELPEELINEIKNTSKKINVQANEPLVNMGDHMDFIPFVESGTVRVFIENDEVNKELLLYYVENGETCMMSIIASFADKKSKVSAITETASTILLIPNHKIREWQIRFEEWNDLILDIFIYRYTDLMQTIGALSFQKIEERLMNYLKESLNQNGNSFLRKTQKQIANDIATSREVVSRTLKKLENENKIKVTMDGLIIC